MPSFAHLRRLLDAGSAHLTDARERRRVVVNNGVALALGGSSLFYAVVLAGLGFHGPALGLVFVGLIDLVAVWLNARARFTASKVVLLVSANTVPLCYLTLFGLAGEVSVFFATICLPLVLAGLKERRVIALGFALSIGCALCMALGREQLWRPSPLSPAAAHGIHVSLVLMTFAVMLVVILSFVVSNARAERKLEDARHGLQRLLDSVDQGFVTVDAKGCIGAERSSVFDDWFGAPAAGTPLGACLGRLDPAVAEAFALGWSQIEEGFLPLEVLVAQLPDKLQMGDRHLRLGYRPGRVGERLVNVLVVLSDVSAEVARVRSEAEQRELLELMRRFAADRNGFAEFVAEADRLVATVAAPPDLVSAKRALHTLKGNAALFGATSVAELCHELEGRLGGEQAFVPTLARALGDLWQGLRARMRVFTGDEAGNGASAITIGRAEIEALLARVAAGASHAEIDAQLRAWTWEPAHARMGRIAAQVRALGQRLRKGTITVVTDAAGLHFEPGRWAPFWTVFAHVVRNGVDHGIEPPTVRRNLGKAGPQITLRTFTQASDVVVEIEDDGRGIDWDAVAKKASALGLPTGSAAALEAALFADGVSTCEEVSDISGRGVGLGAVRSVCEQMGGIITIKSTIGQGTRFRFSFPAVGVVRVTGASESASARPAA